MRKAVPRGGGGQAGPSIPAIGEGKRGEQGHLGYLLRQAGAAHRLRMERALAGEGVTSAQFAVLTMLKAYPGASGADVARLCMLTPQTVSQIVANLERDGLIAREAHAEHGRILQIGLSGAGRAALARCRRTVMELEAQLVEGLTPAEERAVRRWLVAAAK
jgi:DNA-binding MarR family transcriptional regulator